MSSIPTKDFEKLKSETNLSRFSANKGSNNLVQKITKQISSPYLNLNFRGNTRDESIPMDNSFAISRNGFIVSGINSNVAFTGPDGVITYQKGFPDFFTLLGLGTRMYDPRVIYDVEQNRFIFMCLHGSESSNTFLCIAFSKTEDPNGEWNYYKIDGNPSGDNHWFDYPNVAISKNDLYISGLMRDSIADWNYSVLYQIQKKEGYDGNDLTWKYYNDLKDADQQPSFNIVPTPSSWNYLSDPGMYFVSNKPLGGNTYNLYYTTGSLNQNPSLVSLQMQGLDTKLAPDGRQLNTTNVLNTFDSRIWSTLYKDGIIHIGSHVMALNGDVGLFYGRINIAALKIDADILTIPGRDYGFPSFSAFNKKESDEEILVNYLVSGPDILPGQQQRVCSGTGENFDWSNPVTLKEGTSFVDVLPDNNERWGDYTTSCRRFFNDRIENWVTGCFGEQKSYGTWLGQYVNEEAFNTIPMGEFVATKTTAPKNTSIAFKDITQKNASKWQWSFEGGTPETSNIQNPIVEWKENGAYSVTLIVKNDLGVDTITKIDYIHVQDAVVKPIADFSIAKDTIFKDDMVKFTNLSSSNAVTYKWTFNQGSPGFSIEKDPIIRYPKLGSHLVSMTAANIAGTSTKIKQKAVTVISRFTPISEFSASATSVNIGADVVFSDISKGGPTGWLWTIEGGTPGTSILQNPIIKFNNAGVYSVTLQTGNEFGTSTTTKSGYISVGQVGVIEPDF
ncbi:MAG: PKD domain-containing protein [Saprospiraceae bacterium]|nr:PKD domain-containing protein [Saprospiraceae bacterium]